MLYASSALSTSCCENGSADTHRYVQGLAKTCHIPCWVAHQPFPQAAVKMVQLTLTDMFRVWQKPEPFSQQLVERADEAYSMACSRILPNPGHICECQLNHFHSSLWKGLMSHAAWNMAGFCQTLDISVSVS